MELIHRDYNNRNIDPRFNTPELVKAEYERVDGENVQKINRRRRNRDIGSIAFGALSAAMLAGGVFLLAKSQGSKDWIGGGIALTTFSMLPLFGILMTQLSKPRASERINDIYSFLQNPETDPNVAYYAFIQNQDSINVRDQVFFYRGILKGTVKISDENLKALDFTKVIAALEQLGYHLRYSDIRYSDMDNFVRDVLYNTVQLQKNNPAAYQQALNALGKHFVKVEGHQFNAEDLQYFPNLRTVNFFPVSYADLSRIPHPKNDQHQELDVNLTLNTSNLVGSENSPTIILNNVKELIISNSINTSLTLQQLLYSFPNLTSINISLTNQISFEDFQSIAHILNAHKTLKTITFYVSTDKFAILPEAKKLFKFESHSQSNNLLTINLNK